MADSIDLEKYLFKEVDLIQAIINRMARNSFLIKGWAITLIVATLLFRGSPEQMYIAFLPLFSFWYLDGYFLRRERLYRKLHAWIVEHRMQTPEYLLDLNSSRFENKVPGKLKIMISHTLGLFYGLTLLLMLITIVMLTIY